MLFINLDVADLQASRDFYTALDLRVHEQFSDEATLALVLGDEVALMLRTADAVGQPRIAPETVAGVVHTLTVSDRHEADRLVAAGLAAGGRPGGAARADELRYVVGVVDPDGHSWEFMVMEQQHVVN